MADAIKSEAQLLASLGPGPVNAARSRGADGLVPVDWQALRDFVYTVFNSVPSPVGTDEVDNDSGVAGATCTDALDALAAAIAAAVAGLDIKDSVTAATAGALAAYTRAGDVITADAPGAIGNIDGIAIVDDDRILLQHGAAGVDDGIYDVTEAGDGATPFVLTRSSDMADGSSAAGAVFQAEQGATYGEDIFICTNDEGSAVVNTDDLNFTTMTLQGLTSNAPEDVTKEAAAVGTGTKAARDDHKHDISTAAAGAVQIGDSAAEGSATSMSRSDHTHSLAAPAAPEDTTKAAAAAGTATEAARADHKHDISTAAAGAIQVGDSAAEGSATSLARSDHAHSLAAPAAPEDVTKAAAAAGSSSDVARADHKHDVSTAVPSSVGSANAEGSATSLARSDHVHAHGDQAGGSLHADVIAGGADGFMTGTDKTKLDALVVAVLGVMDEDTIGGAHNDITCTIQGDWYPWVSASAGKLLGSVTFTDDNTNGDYLEVPDVGTYELIVSSHFGGSVSSTFEIAVFLNAESSPSLGVHIERKLGVGGDVGSAGCENIKDLAANDELRVKVRCTDGAAKTFSPHMMRLTAKRLA